MRMKHASIASGKRKAVNLSLDTGVVEAAREAGLNLSQVCEAALRDASKQELERRWKEENRDWIEAHSKWVEANELPLEKYRMF
ncbi:type II toxin-antitoxin system CcdA family antitoxin [Sphingomonas sp. DT-207]|uniref:type II toxin-antitoxin system CcdA family antitoxin n=1 Tax=Sphingomonas sp. DT-207 TaxID=3396167 RepID=UPI003F541E63